ncbi:MAG: ribosome silencing factor [Chloroflexota bacterium]
MESLEVAHKIIEVASDKQATDIVLLDVRGLCSFADYFVICSGESERQLRTIQEETEHTLKKMGILAHHAEGTPGSGWILLDFGDIIVHIFSAFERQFYQLDEFWRGAVPLVRIQ